MLYNHSMKLIGVTGAIASGKSTVAKLLQNKGAIVLDADQIAREVTRPGSSAWNEIVDHFGIEILKRGNYDNEIDRNKLADIVFSDPKELSVLNAIVHPKVLQEVEQRLKALKNEYGNGQIIVLDVPLLIEVGWHKRCDMTIVVRAEYEQRLRRLILRGLTVEEAKRITESQKEKERLESRADIIIDNNDTPEDLEKTIERIWQKIQ
jgi:dephospho-CoA kinase